MDSALYAHMAQQHQRGYRELQVWQKSMDLVLTIYEISGGFPDEERYGLRSQLRRAAISVPSNVAEGHCRRTTPAYAHHVSIALGSQGEVETCLELAVRLKYIPAQSAEVVESACAEVGRMLSGLHAALERKR